MADIISFAEAQEKAKDIVAEVLGKKERVVETAPPPVPQWGWLEPLVLSQWVSCKHCNTLFKYSTNVMQFLEMLQNVINTINNSGQHPLFSQECAECRSPNYFSIKNINITACDTKEDGSPWDGPESTPPKAS